MGGWKGGGAVFQFHHLANVLPGPQDLAEADI